MVSRSVFFMVYSLQTVKFGRSILCIQGVSVSRVTRKIQEIRIRLTRINVACYHGPNTDARLVQHKFMPY